MKSISVALRAHYGQRKTTISRCARVTQKNGVIRGLTDKDSDIVFGGVTYMGMAGFNATDVASNNNLDVDNLEISGPQSALSATIADIHAGLWDGAEVKIFEVNWADLSMGSMSIRFGRLGKISTLRDTFSTEFLGLMAEYKKTIIELTSATCRAQLGDARCKFDLSGGSPPSITTGTVDAYNEDTMQMTDAARGEPANFYAYGYITFTGGLNAGLTFEVKTFSGGVFSLQLPPPYTVAVGDAYSAVRGCDGKLDTCINDFGNVENFRGEPYLAGNDKLMRVGKNS